MKMQTDQSIKLDYSISQKQHSFINSNKRIPIFEAGIRSGKTIGLCLRALIRALNRRRFCIVSFSYPNLRDVCLYTMEEKILKNTNIPYQVNKSEMNIFIFGFPILLRSGDKPDSLRGLSLDDFGIDEGREFPDREIFDILMGRISNSPDGTGAICTTTKGRNWVHEIKQLYQNDVDLFNQTTLENPFVSKEYKEMILSMFTNEYARQEIYGEIVEFGAGIINPTWFKIVNFFMPQRGIRYWDVAVSEKTAADFSAGSLLSFQNDQLTIHDIKQVKIKYPDLKRLIISTALQDGTGIVVGVEDAGQQRGFIDDLARVPELRRHTIKALKPRGDKFNRAMPWVARAELGNVACCVGNWNRAFFSECSSFTPNNQHQHDDQIDSISGGYQFLTDFNAVIGARIAI